MKTPEPEGSGGLEINVKSIVRYEPYMLSDTVEARIEQQMMAFGSGPITDLDRFMMPDLDQCDMDGNEFFHTEIGDIVYYDPRLNN